MEMVAKTLVVYVLSGCLLLQSGCVHSQWMNNTTDLTGVTELQCLRDLPVDHLLKIRRALQLLSTDDAARVVKENRAGVPFGHPEATINDAIRANHSGIVAMPLIGNPFKKMGWEPWADEQPTKVQKIFQLSITALSFLAFGGYLLCMIVQAIKSKGTTYYYPSIQSVRNGRPNGRERRDTLDNKQAEPSPDDLYRVMIMAAEGYVRLKSPE